MHKVIIVYGNIGAGKSSVSNELRENLNFEYLNLDDFRIELMFSDPFEKPMIREKKAECDFLKAVEKSGNLIYESSGISRLFKRALLILQKRDFEIIYVKMMAPDWVLKKRISSRKNEKIKVPFPYKTGSEQSTIDYINSKSINIKPNLCFDTNELSPSQISAKIMSFLAK